MDKVRQVQERKRQQDQQQHAHKVAELQKDIRQQHAAQEKRRQSLQDVQDRALISVLDAEEGHERHVHQEEDARRQSLNEFAHHLQHEALVAHRHSDRLSDVQQKQKELQQGHFHHPPQDF